MSNYPYRALLRKQWPCCEFCDTPEQEAAHRVRQRVAYEGSGPAPEGWQLVPFGAPIPSVHREYIRGVGWASPRRCHSTMTPPDARPWGYVVAYAELAGN